MPPQSKGQKQPAGGLSVWLELYMRGVKDLPAIAQHNPGSVYDTPKDGISSLGLKPHFEHPGCLTWWAALRAGTLEHLSPRDSSKRTINRSSPASVKCVPVLKYRLLPLLCVMADARHLRPCLIMTVHSSFQALKLRVANQYFTTFTRRQSFIQYILRYRSFNTSSRVSHTSLIPVLPLYWLHPFYLCDDHWRANC